MGQEGLKTCLGAELRLLTENRYSCRTVLVAKEKNSLSIVSHKESEGTLSEVIESIPKKYPVAICLTGRNIIHKNIRLEETSEDKAFAAAFPSVSPSALYVQQYQEQNNFTISVIRKDTADELLQRLIQSGLRIYTVSLGAVTGVHILPQLNIYNNPVVFDGHVFSLTDEKTFLSYHYDAGLNSAFPVKIGQELFPEKCVAAYSTAFQLVLNEKLPVIEAPVDRIKNDFKAFSVAYKLKKQGQGVLFAFFGLLVLSFMLFSYYNSENEQLALLVNAQSGDANLLELTQQDILDNEQTLKLLKWYGGYNYGYLINEIGKDMPAELQLKEISINDEKAETMLEDTIPQIKIEGTTRQLAAVNNWIFILKEKKWIKDVRLLKFTEAQDGDEYLFNIRINY